MIETNFISHDELRALRHVIDLYVETGEPVSSRMIKSFFRLDESTANIRKMLHRLEELDLVYKPHVSAGRVPSDRGYRVYVDGIRAAGPLNSRIAERVRLRIGKDWRDVRELMSATSHLLSEVTDYMGISMGLSPAPRAVERLEIVRLESRGGLVILTLAPSGVRRLFVRFDREYPLQIVERAVRIINERIAGHPLEDAAGRIESYLREGGGSEREIAAAVTREAAYLFDWPCDLEYSYRGLDRRPEGAELANPRVLQNLVRLMGERTLMMSMLKGRLGSDVSVTIGRENRAPELEDFSVVTRRFRAADREGVLGLLGPTRMTYRLVLALLDATVEELQRTRVGGD